jgi:membrane protease YdiL (CAAX protease family)
MGLKENDKGAIETPDSHRLLEQHKKLLKIRDLKVETLKVEIPKVDFTRDMWLILLLYAISIIFAELTITNVQPAWSLLFLIVIITSLIILSSLSISTKFSHLLQALILIPLLRIMSLSISVTEIGPIYWLTLTILPLIASCIFLMRGQNLNMNDVGLNLKNIPVQLLIIWGGLAIGFIAYLILEPAVIIPQLDTYNIILSVIILLSSGFVLELIFRGIIQQNADNLMGKLWGLLFVSVLFTSQYFAWNSVPYLGFIFGVSIIYGYIFQKTGSILGVSVSHGIANVMLFLIMPFNYM